MNNENLKTSINRKNQETCILKRLMLWILKTEIDVLSNISNNLAFKSAVKLAKIVIETSVLYISRRKTWRISLKWELNHPFNGICHVFLDKISRWQSPKFFFRFWPILLQCYYVPSKKGFGSLILTLYLQFIMSRIKFKVLCLMIRPSRK